MIATSCYNSWLHHHFFYAGLLVSHMLLTFLLDVFVPCNYIIFYIDTCHITQIESLPSSYYIDTYELMDQYRYYHTYDHTTPYIVSLYQLDLEKNKELTEENHNLLMMARTNFTKQQYETNKQPQSLAKTNTIHLCFLAVSLCIVRYNLLLFSRGVLYFFAFFL